MKKSWILDTVLGLVLTCGLAALAHFQVPFTESFESRLYDLRMKYAPKAPLSDQILLVAIDDDSINSVGRWPWPRGVVGQLISQIAAGGPRVIGLNVLYVDPEQNEGLKTVGQIKENYEKLLADKKTQWGDLFNKINKDPRYAKTTKKNPLSLDPFREIGQMMEAAEGSLNNDAQLSQTLSQTPGVVLTMSFPTIDKPLAEETGDSLEKMKGYAVPHVAQGAGSTIVEGFQPLLPLPEFAKGASGIGHCNIFADPDGSVRREALLIKYRDSYFPSLALEMARVALGLNPDQIQATLGREIQLGQKRIPLGADNKMLINYQGTFSKLKTVSAIDILAEKVPADAFKNKLVLIGNIATGIGNLYVVPVEATFPSHGIEITILQNILGETFLSRPSWAPQFELAMLLLVGLFVTLLLPHMRAFLGATLALVLLAAVLGSGVYFFVVKGFWIKIFYGAALLVLAYTLVTIRRFFFTEKRKELVEAESIETNKMLGLSFQGQGMLDIAFEKFRKCPVDDAMKELLYNLALDFERKRQFSKAEVVYTHISKADPGYKDVKDRMKASKTAGETMISAPGLGGARKEGTVMIEGSSVKPTLGRYEIQKELGRGAMGIVYLGKDPKINRAVAIKTVRFDDDVDAETSKSVKERFFREAESAGTLNHPNIIRIFDAGEDNEISYIAMELLDGEDLKKYGEKANLLPVPQVMEYIALVADALDYAHSNGIVHRDIKPANIMRLKDGTLRVTDFGIARITASSKTQTGTVMGTPSYMSPEQIAGKKVDGRADLFSLGVMLYEMLTGEKPFDGDSMATLLFKIANEPHPDPVLKAQDRVTPGVRMILDKALQKNPEMRYQRGGDMAKDIRECLRNPQAIPPNAGINPATSGTSTAVPAPAQPAPSTSDTLQLVTPAQPQPIPGFGGEETQKIASPSPSDTLQMPPSDGTMRVNP